MSSDHSYLDHPLLPFHSVLYSFRLESDRVPDETNPVNITAKQRSNLGPRLKAKAGKCPPGIACEDCPEFEQCVFSYFFVDKNEPPTYNGSSKRTTFPRPCVYFYSLAKPIRPDRNDVDCRLLLIGSAIQHGPILLQLLQQGWGSEGQSQPDVPAPQVITGWDLLQKSAQLGSPRRATIDFISPLQLKRKGKVVEDLPLSFPFFFNYLHRRLDFLIAHYCGGQVQRLSDELKQCADKIKIESCQLEVKKLKHPTYRPQGKKQNQNPQKLTKKQLYLEGYVGRALYRGPFALLVPYLLAGELVHVGSQVTKGLGRYEIRFD